MYRHYVKSNLSSAIPSASMIVLGVLLMFMSIWALREYMPFYVDEYTYNIIRSTFSVFALLFAAIAMRAYCLSEGILLMIAGLSALTFAISELSFGASGFMISSLFFAMCFLICSLIFFLRKNYVITLSTLIIGVTVILGFLSSNKFNEVVGIGFGISGVMILLIGCFMCIRIGAKTEDYVNDRTFRTETPEEYAHVLIETVGMLSFATMSLVLGFYILDASGHSMNIYVVKLALSIIVLIFALYAIEHGIIAEGLMMLILSLSAFMFSITSILGMQGPLILDFILSFAYIPLTIQFLVKRKYMTAVLASLMFLMLFMEVFSHDAHMLEIPIMLVKIVSIYTAVTALLYYEAGISIMPKLSGREELHERT